MSTFKIGEIVELFMVVDVRCRGNIGMRFEVIGEEFPNFDTRPPYRGFNTTPVAPLSGGHTTDLLTMCLRRIPPPGEPRQIERLEELDA